jgi:fused signal recognition particle receptor
VDPIVIALIVIAVLVIAVIGFVAIRRKGEEAPAAPRRAAPVTEDRTLRSRLSKTRRALSASLGSLFGRDRIDADFWQELEDSLVAADVGVGTASELVNRVRADAPADGEAARAALEEELIALLSDADRELHLGGRPAVLLVVGVNGTGKTTSIAKLAWQLQRRDLSVILGAADTYRAAADEQLRTWAHRVGVDIVTGQQGADPASVAFDALATAVQRGSDVVIVDTAGRLHSKTNLMDELGKVARVLRREAGDIDEVLLVLDGTTGQNGIAQARSFTEAVGVTGLILTKLDGTARGGVAVAVERDLGVPVKFIGVGEGMDDLIPFHPRQYVEALLEP